MADIYFEGDAGGEEPVKERWCAFDGVEETQSQRPHLKRMRPLLSFMRFGVCGRVRDSATAPHLFWSMGWSAPLMNPYRWRLPPLLLQLCLEGGNLPIDGIGLCLEGSDCPLRTVSCQTTAVLFCCS